MCLCKTVRLAATAMGGRWPGADKRVVNKRSITFLRLWTVLLIISLFRSAKLRFQLLNMRMNRYFKRSSKVEKIEYYVSKCKLGDWFVLYQLSKNLNRPFFMDFLTHLSVRYTKGHVSSDSLVLLLNNLFQVCSGVEDPDDSEDGLLLGQMNSLLRPSKCKQECEEEKGQKSQSFFGFINVESISLRRQHAGDDNPAKTGFG